MLEFFAIENLEALLASHAYQPMLVYLFVVLFMLASSFGLPIPEEVVLLSSGLLAYMALHPEEYPPPFPGAQGVDVLTLCFVSFLGVFGSDFLVYLIGKYFGGKMIKTKFFQKKIAGKGFETINKWFNRYGALAAGIFRFTPGLRFPGHLSCGLLGLPMWKFIAVDGAAALISVPTQIYLIATYGGVILTKIAEFKKWLLITAAFVGVIWLLRKVYLKWARRPVATTTGYDREDQL